MITKKFFKSRTPEQKTKETISSSKKADILLERIAKLRGLFRIGEKEYEDKRGNKFIKTHLGFVRKDELSLKVEKSLSGKSAAKRSCDRTGENAKEQDYFEQMKQKVKELKYDIARLNVLLDRVVDKNIRTQNKIARVELNSKNQRAQISNLKKANDVLLKENVRLVEEKEK
jgi:hypothetical protein